MSTTTPTIPDLALEHAVLDLLDLEAQVRDLSGDVATYRDLYLATLALVASRDKDIRRLDDANRHLRAQLRAALSGRTIAEERQALDDDDALPQWRAA